MMNERKPDMQIKTKHLGLMVSFFAIVAVLAVAVAIYHGFSARDNPSVGEIMLARLARGLAVPSRAKAMKNPVANTPENMREAMAHWADHCAFCHANDGSGETEVGRNLYPKAPDMRAADTQKLTDGELYYTIKNGVRLTGMPAWGEAGDADEDSWKLVLFIRHLPQLSPKEKEMMKAMDPVTPAELREQSEEDKFLNGGEAKTPPPTGHKDHSHKEKP